MKKFAVFAVFAAMGLATVANAQYNKPSGISLRGGMFFPSSATAKTEGKTWFGVGIDYKVKDMSFGNTVGQYNTSMTLSVDYYGKGDFSHLPVMLNWVSRGDTIYYSMGGGLGFAKTPDGLGGNDTQTEFCYSFAVGYEFSQMQTPFFVEARYIGSAESKLNGYGLFAGIRF